MNNQVIIDYLSLRVLENLNVHRNYLKLALQIVIQPILYPSGILIVNKV